MNADTARDFESSLAEASARQLDALDRAGAAASLQKAFASAGRAGAAPGDAVIAGALRLLLFDVETVSRSTPIGAVPLGTGVGVADCLEAYAFAEPTSPIPTISRAIERGRDQIDGYFAGREIPDMEGGDVILLGAILENNGQRETMATVLERSRAASETVRPRVSDISNAPVDALAEGRSVPQSPSTSTNNHDHRTTSNL